MSLVNKIIWTSTKPRCSLSKPKSFRRNHKYETEIFGSLIINLRVSKRAYIPAMHISQRVVVQLR